MTVVYVPRQEGHEISPEKMQDLIDLTATINPAEQQQYKRFIFCNMSTTEEAMVRRYLKRQLSEQSGVPVKDVLDHQPTMNYIYLKEIGHIKLR